MSDDTRVPAAPDVSAIGLAVLTLLVDEREARVASDRDALSTETLLAEAGLNSTQIGGLVRRSPATVRSTVSRDKKKVAAKKKGGDT